MKEIIPMKKIIIFASGSKEGGGSGFANLVESVKLGILQADIVAVVSNHTIGGVFKHALRYGIPFVHLETFEATQYQQIIADFGADFTCLSGWLKLVQGLDPAKTINIHPGPLPQFGGKSMYGHHVHEAVIAAYERGEQKYSCVTMHFVDPAYDKGPTFFEMRVPIKEGYTAETLAARVNEAEHMWQPFITNLVVSGLIRLEASRVFVPDWYPFLPQRS